MKVCGLYRIRNVKTGGFYIGSSVNVNIRLSNHRCMLRRATHDNIHLQRSFDKHGEGAFTFDLIAIVEVSERLSSEQRFLNRIVGAPLCFNIAPSVVCGTHGRKMPPFSAERLEQMRQRMTGRPVTAESRAKISAANKGRPSANKGKALSPETREKISVAQKGRKLTQEQKDHLRTVNLGKHASEETRAKMSRTRTGQKHAPVSEIALANIRAAAKVRAKREVGRCHHSPAAIERMRESALRRGKAQRDIVQLIENAQRRRP